MSFILPPNIKTESGNIRKVGFEIEFGGLSLEQAAQIILRLYGGSLEKKHTYAFAVKDTKFGEFALESDSRFLSQKKYDSYFEKLGVAPDSVLTENFEKILDKLAGTLVPFEVAMPPIPVTELDAAEKIREQLFQHSAQGTSSSIFAAFGMQMNPELPDLKAETILAYLRSFFLLYDWLVQESDITIARKIAPYINPFPMPYIDLVLNPRYRPDLNQLIEDYLDYSPTRNRPLDLLPLFAYLNKDLVFSFPVEKKLIKPRPTFHYRLPNSEIDDPNWSFAKEWNKWILVEKLAADPDQLAKLTDEYLDLRASNPLFLKSPWITRTQEWIHATT